MAIPNLMVVQSTALPARANRVTNLVVAAVYVIVSAGASVGESWMFFFDLAVVLEVNVLAFIIRSAWTWPRTHGRRPWTRSVSRHVRRPP